MTAQSMTAVVVINAVLAFALELGMLWAYGDWGWRVTTTTWLRWCLALGVPALAIVMWALWGAPRSATRLGPPWLYVFEWSMFATAAVAQYSLGREQLALGYILIASLNLAIASRLS